MNILESVTHFDSTSQRIVWKGLANSALYQLSRNLELAVLEQHRTLQRTQTTDTDPDGIEALLSSLDERNEQDNHHEHDVPNNGPLGLEKEPAPSFIDLSKIYLGFAQYCIERAETLAQSRWEQPMSFSAMLKFRLDSAGTGLIPAAMAYDALADFINVSKEDFLKVKEIEASNQKERFKLLMPEIVDLYNTLRKADGGGYQFSYEELPLLAKHRMTLKVLDVIFREWTRIIKRPSLEGFATIGILNSTAKTVEKFIDEFEHQHADELAVLIEEIGIMIPSVSDIRHRYPLVRIKA
jgi:hypothetical protein